MKFRLLSLALCLGLPVTAQVAAPDPWAQVRFLVGDWTGISRGEPGTGTAIRHYQFILAGRFLQERNVSTYAAKQPDKPGEVHEHWSLISYDRKRKRLVLRQFHQEGFVNQYVLDEAQSSATRLVFESEAFENLDSRWRARETYALDSSDAFTETFEIAPPGKAFSVYSSNAFTRTKPK